VSDPQRCKARIAVSSLNDAVERFTDDLDAALEVLSGERRSDILPATALRCLAHTPDDETDAAP
jgi:hypothetical protein